MAYTKHGHHIPNSPTTLPRPALVARCGGPKICNKCMTEAILWNDRISPISDKLVVQEQTMLIVYNVLQRYVSGDTNITNCINELLNNGILFRERQQNESDETQLPHPGDGL